MRNGLLFQNAIRAYKGIYEILVTPFQGLSHIYWEIEKYPNVIVMVTLLKVASVADGIHRQPDRQHTGS